MGRASDRVTFAAVLAVAEFRALWAAELLSLVGDQLARVALAVLVFTRTNSAALTALTYALTFAPALAGAVLLGGLGDRHPRREVLVVSDVVRAALVAAMAIPGMPLWLLCVLVAAMTFVGGPFKAAHQALIPALFSDTRTYTTGLTVRNITGQAAQVAGFAGGGVMVAGINSSVALLADAATFLASAVILRRGIAERPAAATNPRPSGVRAFLASVGLDAQLVWRDPQLWTLTALCWLGAFYVAPEALAAPYAAALGAGAGAVGLLMASDPAGSVLGAYIFNRWVPEWLKPRVIGVLGVLAGLPLVLCALSPGLVVSTILFGLSGMMANAYTLQAVAIYTLRLPDRQRAHGSGLLGSGLTTVQGLGALVAGALADSLGPVSTVMVAGIAGMIVAVPVAVAWHRARCHGAR